MKISIAMCTYNGELYLREQLDSILNQTKLPDEVVICDDRSTDSTWSILEEFQKKEKITVKIIKNSNNLGCRENFAKAINLCTGDIIFLADQDDVWFPQKIKVMTDVFASEPEVGMVFTDAIVTDEHLKPYPSSLWQYVEFNSTAQAMISQGQLWSRLVVKSYVTGATMAFRSKWRSLLQPFPISFVHDEWITLVADMVSRIKFVEDKLICYRQHQGQQIGVRTHPFTLWRKKIFPGGNHRKCPYKIHRIEEVLEHVDKFRDSLRDPNIYNKLLDQLSHWQARASLPQERWLRWKIIKEELHSGRYLKYSGSNRMVVKDLLD